MKNVYVINDRTEYNITYRSGLLDVLVSFGYSPVTVGAFESITVFVSVIVKLLSSGRKNRLFVSSNLRTNILVSLFPAWCGLVIVNGLGRYRNKSLFRLFLLKLIRFNTLKKYVFQNYADFRWARRYSGVDVFWVPGSGGVPREINTHSTDYTCILRPSKLAVVRTSLSEFTEILPHDSRINIVGIYTSDLSVQSVDDPRLVAVGYQDQSKVISFGGTLFVPDGYGEGIPHVMVDALVSGLPVVLSKKAYTKYGLSKLSIKSKKFHSEWVIIGSCPDVSRETLGVEVISERYFSLLSAVS